jgi:ribosomal protein S18 acetylase RimI-like enzyme
VGAGTGRHDCIHPDHRGCPERRGQGVGGELLRRVEGSAIAAGAQLIWLHVDAENAAAIRLYEANGYRIEGRKEKYYPHGRAALICLKALDSELDPPAATQ